MKAEELKEKLMRNKKTGWVGLQEEEKNKIFSYCEQYMQFMNNSKTEREVVKNAKTLFFNLKSAKNVAFYVEIYSPLLCPPISLFLSI